MSGRPSRLPSFLSVSSSSSAAAAVSHHDSIAAALSLKISTPNLQTPQQPNNPPKKTLSNHYPPLHNIHPIQTQPTKENKKTKKCLQLPTKPTAKSTISPAPNSANNSLTFSSPPEPTNLPTKALRGVLLLPSLLLVKFLRRGDYWKGNNLKKEVWVRGRWGWGSIMLFDLGDGGGKRREMDGMG